jgi:small-conductance mechanosensitive channel
MQLDSVHSSLRAVLARVARAGLILIAVLVSLSLVGLDLTVLSVFGGALGVGIGLGLQKLVSSYVSGFVILLERSLAIGDTVTVDRFSGVVEEIKTRYTVLRSSDGTESVIPNEMLVSSPVQNFCLTNRNFRLTTRVTVAYGTDIDRLFPELIEVVGNVPRVSNDPSPEVLLQRLALDGLDLDIEFWVVDPENGRAGVTSEVNKAIWRLFQKQNVSIPHPQRDVRILNVPENILAK